MERLNNNVTTGDSDEGRSTWGDDENIGLTKEGRNGNSRNGINSIAERTLAGER